MDKYRMSNNNEEAGLKEISSPASLNIDGILSAGIPDIAPVYGGVRGRTMSSKAQAFAWPVIKECGITTLIDLREDGVNTRLQRLCYRYGMEYFYYPVDKKLRYISEMVSMFPQFCNLIDRGRFYISCAMGLHRTDIALCTYWMFYGADQGLALPPVRGYRRADGHDVDKIMRVLNAFYKCLCAQGKAPFAQDIFNQRKKAIKAQSEI